MDKATWRRQKFSKTSDNSGPPDTVLEASPVSARGKRPSPSQHENSRTLQQVHFQCYFALPRSLYTDLSCQHPVLIWLKVKNLSVDNAAKEAEDGLCVGKASSKWQKVHYMIHPPQMAEMLMLHEILDSSVEEEIVINSEDNGEIVMFAAAATFMRSSFNRNEGYFEVSVPTYSIDEFRSHYRMTRSIVEALCREIVCDDNMIFRDILVGWPGSVHYSRVLRNSSLFATAAAKFPGDTHLGDGR
ncbi:hypothetical protein ACROYT_G014587 [Oculina patagonica]